MKVIDLLTPDLIVSGFTATDKWEAIGSMPARMVAAGVLPKAMQEVAVEALLARERKLTTGMENGVAIPHAALDDLPGAAAVLCLAPAGIPFDTLDGEPGRLLVGLLTPRQERLQHIRILADFARLLADASVRAALLAAPDAESAWAILRDRE